MPPWKGIRTAAPAGSPPAAERSTPHSKGRVRLGHPRVKVPSERRVQRAARASSQQAVPVERGAGVVLARRHVLVAEHTLELGEPFLGERVVQDLAVGIARHVEMDLREDPAERRGELGERLPLLLGVVVHPVVVAVDLAIEESGAVRPRDEVGRADPGLLHPGREHHPHAPAVVALVPLLEGRVVGRGVGADVRDLDADRMVVGDPGVPGALLQVERLVDRAVHVEHEVDRQVPLVLQDLEALPRRPADVEVDHELRDRLLEVGQRPTVVGDVLGDRFVEVLARSEVVESDRLAVVVDLGVFEPRIGRVGVVAARVGPEDHRRADVEQPAADDDLVARAFMDLGARRRAAPDQRHGGGQQERGSEQASRGKAQAHAPFLARTGRDLASGVRPA